MLNNLNKFADKLNKMANDLPKYASQIVRESAISSTTEVINDTPRYTAQAKNNWITRIDKIATHTRSNKEVAIKQLLQYASKYDATKHTSIYVVNNLPYINILNQGRVDGRGSEQQPNPYFVERAIERGLNEASKKWQKLYKV